MLLDFKSLKGNIDLQSRLEALFSYGASIDEIREFAQANKATWNGPISKGMCPDDQICRPGLDFEKKVVCSIAVRYKERFLWSTFDHDWIWMIHFYFRHNSLVAIRVESGGKGS